MKSWIIKQLVRWMTPRLRFIWHNPALWRYVEARGYHVTPVHFYQPIPDTGALDRDYRPESALAGIDWNEDEQRDLLRLVFPRYAAEFTRFLDDFEADERFAGRKLEFTAYDPYVYHCMIRHFRPAQIVEVGAGFSTLVAANAARLNGGANISAIEPYPNDFLLSLEGAIDQITQRAQDIDLAFFERLSENDILFIDSSHVVKTGSDVCFLILEVLPRLQRGVIVHFHDIFLPYDYPRHWLKQKRLFWNEQYLVQAWLIHNQRARIVFANRTMSERHKDLMLRTFPAAERTGGGSLWLRV